MSCRIQGAGIGDCGCFRLNTPKPIMSACVAPPNCPDPFRTGPHPIRDLGSPTWATLSSHPQMQFQTGVIQLTQEEDQAITSLLKLHHHKAATEPCRDIPAPSTESNPGSLSPEEPMRTKGPGWSETEFEVASTLLHGFNQEEVLFRCPNLTQVDRRKPRNGQGMMSSKELTSLEKDAVCVLLSLRDT